MRKRVVFLIYLLLSSYLNVGFVGFSSVSAKENIVFYDDFNDNSLDTTKWTEDVVGSGNSYTEANGEAQFITKGSRTGSYTTEHSFLRSTTININDWSYIVFSGSWKFTNPGTAEMWFRIHDADTGNYMGVRYVSWPSDKITYDRPEGSITDYRTIPRSYVPFKVVLYRDRFEYWESGSLIKTVPTSVMENTTNFQLLIGGWDDTPTFSYIYFDNITVAYEPAAPEGLKIAITSPEERTYNTSTIDLNVTANKPVDEWRYSLNGGENVTFEPNTTITAEEGENLLVVYALAGDERAEARVNFYVDTTPPGTVENLTHEVGADYIHWTWDNPSDEDFETALVYIDGKFQGETEEGEWWLEELSPGETHTIGILTRDYAGNVNTTWVNDTTTTLTPSETVYVNESGWWYEGSSFNPSETPLQDGVKAALEGGTVIVLSGTYPESVEIDKSLTVETDEGAEVRGDGEEWDNGMKPVFYVSSDNVTLRGFTINSSVSNIGVWIDGVGNCTVEGNAIIVTETSETVRYGVYLSYGGNNAVRNNEISVSGFQGIGIYVYEEEKESTVNGNTVTVMGDSADGIEVFYTSSDVYDNVVSIDGVAENGGYALYLYLAGDSSINANNLTTNLSEASAWAINVVAEFRGSLNGNRINGVLTEITCPGDCMIRGVSQEERPAPPEGYGDVGEYLEAEMDSWLWLAFYYEDDALTGLQEDTLQVWRFIEGWTLEGTSDHQLEASKNLVGANLTQSGIFAPLAQEENDVTPPVLTFAEPTPGNGSLIEQSHVIFNLTSNENLSSATIELDGVNHTMTGSGKEWSYETDVADGVHTFRAYGRDLAGNTRTSEKRSFEVDTKAPKYSSVGQDRDGIPQGGTVNIHALWSDPHLAGAVLYTNVTGSWEDFDEVTFEGTEGWSNFSVTLDEPGLYCWRITGYDALNHENTTPVYCFEVYAPPEIISHSPESPVESYEGQEVSFSITADQLVNVTWYVGEREVFSEENVFTSTYTNSTPKAGEYGVTAIVQNANGSASWSWVWYVYPRPSLSLEFVPPTPETRAMLNVRTVTINVTSSMELDGATLEWNGVNESMSGEGTNWWVSKENLPDGTYTFRVYGSSGDLTNSTEERTVEIDATPPRVLEAGQESERVIAGESVEVFALWSDSHLDSAVMWTNASEGFEWVEIPLEPSNGWSNHTIQTDESFAGKTLCWYIEANDTFGNENETETLCFRVVEPLRIVSFSPEAEEVTLGSDETADFSVELSREANVTWYVNESEVLREEGSSSTYSNSSLIPGIWNVSVVARVGEEMISHWWLMRVGNEDTTPPRLVFVEPTPENGGLVGRSEVVFNLTSNEELSWAVLELDGENHTMSSNVDGKNWWLEMELSEGDHHFRAYGSDVAGNTNSTGEVRFKVDLTPPDIEVSVPSKVEMNSEAEARVVITDAAPDRYEVRLNGRTIANGTYASGNPIYVPINTSKTGNLTYHVYATDVLGHGSERNFTVEVVDTTPPMMWFIEPTPENGSLLGCSTVHFVLTSNEPLASASLYIDGVRYSLTGSGYEWSASITLEDGVHVFYADGRDEHGNENETPLETFEIDTTAPAYLRYGLSEYSVVRGSKVTAYSLWGEEHPWRAFLETNESGSWEVAGEVEYSDWANFTVDTGGLTPGVYCARIRALDELNHENLTPPCASSSENPSAFWHSPRKAKK
ncbi:hypothetical protein FH039_09135 [Thermococcus indicus]|uniref:Right handed beta helix domain-containing protein n=1 Tax=Thermococcus indicus TaxID=2586643 RepID=A0A4Y5SLH0_9EURY|nr:Ig-like domain-containing protein [Thermococcus indicus]QDA31728.1 hypothetical protein FH039_09135 [Thermococcus indicus]